MILVLMLLAVGNHPQPARAVQGAGVRRTGAAGRRVRDRRARGLCRNSVRRAVPRRGAGDGVAAPAVGSLLVFAALGLGLAIPFVAVAFIPALRDRLPKPGPWMERLQRFLAIPMAATAVACLWLLWRVGAGPRCRSGWSRRWSWLLCLFGAGLLQRAGKQPAMGAAMAAVAVAVAAVSAMPQRSALGERAVDGVEQWSEAAVADSLRRAARCWSISPPTGA